MTAQDKHRAKRLAHRLWKEYRARRRPEVVQALEDAQWRRVNGL